VRAHPFQPVGGRADTYLGVAVWAEGSLFFGSFVPDDVQI
jgi:hypothetical protein